MDKFYLAPLQSYTDFHFRNAFQQVFEGVSRFYAPYLKMDSVGTIKESTKRDILPKNNPFEQPIPQVLACCAEDFLVMADFISSLGYTEINWNLGCPYPMVAKRDLGAGILNKPDKILSILNDVQKKTSLKIGIKMRMGYESTEDILSVLPCLNDIELTEVIVHGRYAKQLYKGGIDLERFRECIALTNHKLVYNGDINTVQEFLSLRSAFPEINNWMIGRGAVSNPFIFEMIRNAMHDFPADHYAAFSDFLQLLLESYQNHQDNKGVILQKMKHYWEYFSLQFDESSNYFRKVKKIKSLDEYSEFIIGFSEENVVN